jgi:hypothetical protein
MFDYDPTTPLESPACDQKERKGKEREARKQKIIRAAQTYKKEQEKEKKALSGNEEWSIESHAGMR